LFLFYLFHSNTRRLSASNNKIRRKEREKNSKHFVNISIIIIFV